MGISFLEKMELLNFLTANVHNPEKLAEFYTENKARIDSLREGCDDSTYSVYVSEFKRRYPASAIRLAELGISI